MAIETSTPVKLLTLGGQKYLVVSDISQVFKEILAELKINNAYLKEIVGETLTMVDVED